MQTTTRFLPLLLSISALGLSGCGGSPADENAAAPSAVAANGARTIKLSADDAMRFSATQLEARPGELLRIVFTNTGRVPKQAMAHNWVLLKPASDTEINAFGMAAATALPDYIPAAQAGQVLAHTKILGPGETDTVEFTAPETPGAYPFLCTFPGHFAMMKGQLLVK